MARVLGINNVNQEQKKKEPEEVELGKVIDDYFEFNSNKNKYDKLAKEKATIIKDTLKQKGLNEFSSGNHKATISTSTNIEYNDEILLKLVKALPEELSSQLIQKIEVVNLEKFERLLIEGKINAKQFVDAEETKTTVKLYVK